VILKVETLFPTIDFTVPIVVLFRSAIYAISFYFSGILVLWALAASLRMAIDACRVLIFALTLADGLVYKYISLCLGPYAMNTITIASTT
jgi:hypothetical protein